MVKDFVKINRCYFLLLFVMFLVFMFFKYFFIDLILNIDETIISFVQNNVVNNNLTSFFKIITNLGDVLFFVSFIVLVFLIFRNKKISVSMSINLLFTYLFSVVFKNIFRRERPLFNLIDKPKDFSFPSGHTMCSVAFYGFIIYLIFRYVDNKFLKYFLSLSSVLIIIAIGFSRIYLNVHFLSDVISGALLGFICLLMFINYVRIKGIL